MGKTIKRTVYTVKGYLAILDEDDMMEARSWEGCDAYMTINKTHEAAKFALADIKSTEIGEAQKDNIIPVIQITKLTFKIPADKYDGDLTADEMCNHFDHYNEETVEVMAGCSSFDDRAVKVTKILLQNYNVAEDITFTFHELKDK